MEKELKSEMPRASIAFLLLVLLILPIYSNTFQASWHFDDKPNILDNQRLHIKNLLPSSIVQTFFSLGGTETFWRPLPNLSLGLNWYYGQDNTLGYHVVNLTIHILTAFLLFLACRALLQAPQLKDRYRQPQAIHFIALLTAVLWAINPIQIQAVTYIVQRMASMAAMFYIASIYFFIKARMAAFLKTKLLLFTACSLCAGCALMSKENAALLPFSLLLLEITFFRSVDLLQWAKTHALALTCGALAAVGIIFFLFYTGSLDFLFRGYTLRTFTLWERLLAQPRIVLFYISQIFYPLPSRLSIAHDVTLSPSLFFPWTTLPAILVIVVMLGLGIRMLNKWPLVSFAILFFFLNHAIESTILPLELIFEHRNYLPSLFVFLPIAAGLWTLFDSYRLKNRFMFNLLVGCLVLVMIGLGCFTYIRNRDWRNETTLWYDAMKKAPMDARPPWTVAINLAWDKNVQMVELDVALALFEKALTLNQVGNTLDAHILRNMGLIYAHKGDHEQARKCFEKGIRIDPNYLKNRYNLIHTLVREGEWDAAIEQTEKGIAVAGAGRSFEFFKLKGYILLLQQRPEEALVFLRKALSMNPEDAHVLLDTGTALSRMGKYVNAGFLLNRAIKESPHAIRTHYALIENSIKAKKMQKARLYTRNMLGRFKVKAVIDGLNSRPDNHTTVPMASEMLAPLIKSELLRMSTELVEPSS